ncbi:hypothetical protein PV08_06911 [Exophiala spinifera]|uniref:Major facilitator superfamily (MFS) profile domain-containing protein n=1 Tax=Exophiala spinifera TaxID=91928 RepID=A0A0D2B620_9EURO|nr:uncharacterized protein PV08_06911 [Exophiala spinifera]KIW14130.1 hypothetical protein PV08_06911 [Exophiala spinifera]
MPSPTDNLPIYILSSIVLLGAFSRFTHGVYTPQFYAFQENHAPDDGSLTATITPIVDTLVGLSLLFGSRVLRLFAASLSVVFFTLGLGLQMQADKAYGPDVALVVLGIVALFSQLRK